jgi:hypothetical protein
MVSVRSAEFAVEEFGRGRCINRIQRQSSSSVLVGPAAFVPSPATVAAHGVLPTPLAVTKRGPTITPPQTERRRLTISVGWCATREGRNRRPPPRGSRPRRSGGVDSTVAPFRTGHTAPRSELGRAELSARPLVPDTLHRLLCRPLNPTRTPGTTPTCRDPRSRSRSMMIESDRAVRSGLGISKSVEGHLVDECL